MRSLNQAKELVTYSRSGRITKIRRKFLAALATIGIAFGVLVGGAASASALSKSGTIKCAGGGSVAAVHGEQQLIGHKLKLTVGGATLFNESGVYKKTAISNLTGTRTWSASSISLLLNASKGRCMPPA